MIVKLMEVEAEPVFEPIELKLTIESKEEFLELWSLTGLSVGTVNEMLESEGSAKYRIAETKTTKLWNALDLIKDERENEA